MENLYTVRQIAIKLSISEKGIYSWILSARLKPEMKKSGVGLYSIESFHKPKLSFSECGDYLILQSRLNTMEL